MERRLQEVFGFGDSSQPKKVEGDIRPKRLFRDIDKGLPRWP